NTVTAMASFVYPNIENGNYSDKFLWGRSILSCQNDDVDDINTFLMNHFPGEQRTYHSADKILDE
ncbi:hypothetical protein L218DRAFT_800610, partial [Marasmius fiardii PR-910]